MRQLATRVISLTHAEVSSPIIHIFPALKRIKIQEDYFNILIIYILKTSF